MAEIVVRLVGGLGNQMFQYAAARSLALRSDSDLVLDVSWFGTSADRRFSLDVFNIVGRIIGGGGEVGDRGKGIWEALKRKISRHRGSSWNGYPVFHEKHFHFDSKFFQVRPPAYLDGYWQSEKYFYDHRDIIAGDFSIKAPAGDKTQKLLAEIKKCNAVGLHIRRGDYVSNRSANAYHGMCSDAYYHEAVRLILERVAEPHFFIFSDDPVWVVSSFTIDCPMTVVDCNTPDQAYDDLRLMAACKHFIIANSSFSWWGAWLGRHPEKTVIAPKKWFKDSQNDTRDLLPEGWLTV